MSNKKKKKLEEEKNNQNLLYFKLSRIQNHLPLKYELKDCHSIQNTSTEFCLNPSRKQTHNNHQVHSNY